MLDFITLLHPSPRTPEFAGGSASNIPLSDRSEHSFHGGVRWLD